MGERRRRFQGFGDWVRLGFAPALVFAAAVAPVLQRTPAHAQQIGAAQQPIGSVSLADANVTGAVATANDRAQLAGNGGVTAKDRVAFVQLARGGSVEVCATSGLHLTAGAAAATDTVSTASLASANADAASTAAATPGATAAAAPVAPLMLALDRGALELRMNAIPSDVLMTPDLRIAFSEAGPLDLRIRVTRNGDTCVENRVIGTDAHPALRVGSLFGEGTYDVLPGQHVLFERASLHEVVDNESSPCGCPAAVPAPAAQLGQLSLKPGEKTSSTQAEALHPFPAAVSQGLAPPPEVPQAPPGVTHSQVATTLVYKSEAPEATAPKPPAPAAATPVPASTAKPAQQKGFFHSIGRFFKRIF
jgi:hypothetical protein